MVSGGWRLSYSIVLMASACGDTMSVIGGAQMWELVIKCIKTKLVFSKFW